MMGDQYEVRPYPHAGGASPRDAYSAHQRSILSTPKVSNPASALCWNTKPGTGRLVEYVDRYLYKYDALHYAT